MSDLPYCDVCDERAHLNIEIVPASYGHRITAVLACAHESTWIIFTSKSARPVKELGRALAENFRRKLK